MVFYPDKVMFHNNYSANYHEIPLWGWGVRAEFFFDSENTLKRVEYREMVNDVLELWGDKQICIIENFHCPSEIVGLCSESLERKVIAKSDA